MSETADNKWQRRYEREKAARLEAEKLLEAKSLELYEANQKLSERVASQDTRIRLEAERFRQVFDSALDGIILHNLEGVILEVNKMATTMFGISREDFLNKNITLLTTHDHRDLAQKALEEVVSHGSTRYQSEFVRSDGSCFPAEVSATSFKLGNHTIIHWNLKDVTDARKRLAEMKQARKSAEQANDAKTLFLGTMSHELRTPLNGIIGFSDLLLQTEQTHDQKRFTKLVQGCANSLQHLIADLLNFTTIERGKFELEPAPVQLGEFFSEIEAVHQIQAESKGLSLHLILQNDLPEEVVTDAARLRQVVSNLVSNAIKFSKQGEVTVTVAFQDGQLIVSVKDNGPGLPQDNIERLFEPYHRGEASHVRHNEGTGLGLAICHRLITAMQGEIFAQNRSEGGAEFLFAIPVVHNPLIADRQEPSEPESPQPTTTDLKPRVLIAEDNSVNAELLRLLVEKHGCEVTVTPDGEAALDELRKDSSYKALLADLHMPKVNGFELARAIRAGEAGSRVQNIPLVAVTANLMETDRKEALQAGMDSFLSKPLRPDKLTACLKKLGLV